MGFCFDFRCEGEAVNVFLEFVFLFMHVPLKGEQLQAFLYLRCVQGALMDLKTWTGQSGSWVLVHGYDL